MKRYLQNSIENMRDIGGYTAGNKKVKYGKLIRSNLPANVTPEDLKVLKEIGVKTVIDLRSEEEVEKAGSVFEKNPCFKLLHYKLKGGGKIPENAESVPISYMQMLEGKESIYSIFKEISKGENGIIYFCNAGKDRTGVITALLLMTLGVKNEDIIEDYALSENYLQDMLDKIAQASKPKDVKEIITPKAKYMEKFLQYFHEKYGSVNQYLQEIGITEEEINKIKENCIEA